MKVPFLDLKTQYQGIKRDVEPSIMDILENCCYIGGSYVQQFEESAQNYLGVKHAASLTPE